MHSLLFITIITNIICCVNSYSVVIVLKVVTTVSVFAIVIMLTPSIGRVLASNFVTLVTFVVVKVLSLVAKTSPLETIVIVSVTLFVAHVRVTFRP